MERQLDTGSGEPDSEAKEDEKVVLGMCHALTLLLFIFPNKSAINTLV